MRSAIEIIFKRPDRLSTFKSLLCPSLKLTNHSKKLVYEIDNCLRKFI